MNTPRGRGRREFHASLNKISIGILFASLDFTVFVAAEPTSRLEWSTFHATVNVTQIASLKRSYRILPCGLLYTVHVRIPSQGHKSATNQTHITE